MDATYFILLLLCFNCVFYSHNSKLSGCKLYRLTPTDSQLQLLKNFTQSKGFQFWNEAHTKGDNLDIMACPEKQESFLKFLEKEDITYETICKDVQRLLNAEKRSAARLRSKPSDGISFDRYHRHPEIEAYLEDLEDRFPELVTLEKIGESNQGRDLVMIRISKGGSENPAVLIDAGIHAREWIAPAMALYIIQQLVENSNESELTEGLDWYIIPVLNPDGYEYSHKSDRVWRKTRTRNTYMCYGVDGNRNYDFHWGEGGTSSDPCEEIYAGPNAFSEPETVAIRDFALENKNIKLYMSFHSYGNYILYPWGYTEELPSDWKELDKLAKKANDAHVAAGGESYTIGSSTNVLYVAAGGSDDYMKAVANISLSYTIELTDNITGFVYPASKIEDTVKKFFAAVRVFGNHVKHKKRSG